MMRRPVVRRGRPGLVGTVARTAVIAGTATATANAVNKRSASKAEQQAQAEAQQAQQQQAAMEAAAQQAVADAQAQQAAAAPAPAPAAPAGGDDLLDKLQKLADLKAQGILSDEEFAAAKAQLLAG